MAAAMEITSSRVDMNSVNFLPTLSKAIRQCVTECFLEYARAQSNALG